MPANQRARLKQWLDSGEAQLHPLTFPQRELWEASPVPVEDNANHICCLIDVHGILTEREGRAGIQRVVDRQEVLRLSILPGKERPLQMVRKNFGIEFDYREVNDARQETIEELAAEIFRAPFDLMQGPLYRAADLRRGPNEHVLVFAIHHAIADGWSLGVLVQDLFAAYIEVVIGSSESLPAVPQTYSAWGAIERVFWKPEMLEQRVGFWKTKLAGSPRMWDAPITTGPPTRWLSEISPVLTNETRELARRTSITLFNTLFGAFQIAFFEWSGFDDLVVGTPVANRTKQSARETMGYYSGIVPLRAQIDPARVVADHLRVVHETTTESFANAIPFVELVRALGERSAPGYNPLFEVRFAFQNHPMPEISLPNLSARLSMRSTGTARFLLGCEITEAGDGLEVAWLFRENLFLRHDIESLDGIFQRVLAGICRSPENRISEVPEAISMNAAIDKDFSQMHEPHWVLRGAFQLLVFGLAFTEGMLAITVHRGLIWLAVPLVLVASHLMHGMLIGLHEASHGLLRKSRRFNEFDGVVIGTLSLMSFSLYRVVHQTHHAYLATERDHEFWPLSQTTVPRWKRCLAAFFELNLGLVFTPFVFLRAFFSSRSPVRSKRVRRRIWAELALTVVAWTLILSAVAAFDLWKYFIWMYLAPALLAANLQSWRKYIEHVGMTGDTVNSITRSIVAKSWLGRLVAFTLLHEPFHGVHHQRAGLPHSVLPQHVEKLQPKKPGERAPYTSYRYALIELVRSLPDPRVGPQSRTLESVAGK